jgi:hypothetical protein
MRNEERTLGKREDPLGLGRRLKGERRQVCFLHRLIAFMILK